MRPKGTLQDSVPEALPGEGARGLGPGLPETLPKKEEQKKPLVFCVDDDRNILSWMELILVEAGYAVQSETDARRAVDLILATHPDVIILDVGMPEMDGYEVCRVLQQWPETAYVPVIFVTAREGEQDRAKAFRVGAVDYLVKPIQEQAFLASVAAQCANHRKWLDMRRVNGKQKSSIPQFAHLGVDRWSARFYPVQFVRFKQFLGEKLRLSPVKQEAVLGLSTQAMYTGTLKMGITGRPIAQAMAEFLEVPYVAKLDLGQVKLGVFPVSFSLANQIVALRESGDDPTFVVSNPFGWETQEILDRVCDDGKSPNLAITEPASFEGLKPGAQPASSRTATMPQIEAQLKQEYAESPQALEEADRAAAQEGPLIELVNRLIEEGYLAGASDVHIEPNEADVVVRYRIDGDLRIVRRLQPPELIRRIVARIKIMSSLDVTEHRLPQDGRSQFKEFGSGESDFDLRVAILPVHFGEKACLRIIDKQKAVLPLDRLGFSERNLQVYREKIRAPHGMILHVGPTGSGKSMSLYAALNELVTPALNIQTAEDPIEYTLPGINQTQMHSDIGLTFARALRSILRADPDIILVGEIRDLETAKTAIEASLTGHLLFSTLHTNDAASTVQRFIEMGIESYLISSTLLLVCAQRLLKRLCPDCKEAYVPENQQRLMAGLAEDERPRLYRPKGCEHCSNLGYRGRIAIHEILVPNDTLRRAINRPGISSEEIKRIAVEECGMTTLFQDAMEKVRAGLCSIEDALANVAVEEIEQSSRREIGAGLAGLAKEAL
jgi:type IV pilus assembly protein PilB